MRAWELSSHCQGDDALGQREFVYVPDSGPPTGHLVLWLGMNRAGSVGEREQCEKAPDGYAVPFGDSSIFILDRS